MADRAVAEAKLLHACAIKGNARNAVLNTAELLENVLFHLPARQLFTVKRVSRRFKAAVEKSTDIQSKMFLRMQEPDESWGVLGEPPSVVLIPQRPGQIFGCANSTMKVVKANSAFFKEPGQSADEMARFRGPQLGLHAGMKGSIDAFLKGKSQPWEDMHITDPPSTSVLLEICQINLGLRHKFGLCATVDNQSGVTLGGLLRESFAQKRPLFFYSDGDAVDLRGRSVREFLEDSEQHSGFEVSFDRLPVIHIPDVVIPTDAERERMKLRASRGQTGGEQRGFTFDWVTPADKIAAARQD